jgi:uncharacterized Fe-S center protein
VGVRHVEINVVTGGLLVSDVYMVDARATGVLKSYPDKIGLLLSVPEFAAMIPQGKRITVIKANYSQVGYTRYIRPVVMRTVVEKVMELGGTPAIVDTSGYFPKGQLIGGTWLSAAETMGYSIDTLGCDKFLANGYEGDDGEFFSTGGSELGGVEVARAICEAECIIMVSQVSAHPQAGMFGALANLGIECLNNSGKARVYENLKPSWHEENCQSCGICASTCQWEALTYVDGRIGFDETRCSSCGTCLIACQNKARQLKSDDVIAFQRRVTESAAAIVKTLNKNVIYVNFLTDIVPEYYRFSWADVPFVPDLGILASTDPVAIDKLSMDLIKWAPGIPGSAAEDADALTKGVDKFRALTGVDAEMMFSQAESLGLGSKDYEVLIAGR